jgi:hypothetical protein
MTEAFHMDLEASSNTNKDSESSKAQLAEIFITDEKDQKQHRSVMIQNLISMLSKTSHPIMLQLITSGLISLS